jgi:hypothetical protein
MKIILLLFVVAMTIIITAPGHSQEQGENWAQDQTPATIFVGWLRHSACDQCVVKIIFPRGGHVSYSGTKIQRIVRELEKSLKSLKRCERDK